MAFVMRTSSPTLRVTTFAVLALSLTNCGKPSMGSAIRPYYEFEVVDTNGDGIDDIVGASNNGMAVVDGKTFKARMLGIKPPEIWRLLNGKIITAARETPRVLHVVEFSTGAVLKTFQLTDNVATLRETKGNVFVQLRDQHAYLLDLTTLRLIEQLPRLPAPGPYQPIFCAGARAACSWDDKTNSSPNVVILSQGSHRVSVRIKQSGPRQLSLVCFDASGQQTGPVVIDENGAGLKGIELADGRLFISYLGAVSAYDAATCTLQWQRQQLAAEVIQAQHGRLYVTTEGRPNYGKDVVVLDAATGVLLVAL